MTTKFVILALLIGVSGALPNDIAIPENDRHTILLLQVNADGSALYDAANQSPVRLEGGRIESPTARGSLRE